MKIVAIDFETGVVDLQTKAGQTLGGGKPVVEADLYRLDVDWCAGRAQDRIGRHGFGEFEVLGVFQVAGVAVKTRRFGWRAPGRRGPLHILGPELGPTGDDASEFVGVLLPYLDPIIAADPGDELSLLREEALR